LRIDILGTTRQSVVPRIKFSLFCSDHWEKKETLKFAFVTKNTGKAPAKA